MYELYVDFVKNLLVKSISQNLSHPDNPKPKIRITKVNREFISYTPDLILSED